MFRAAPDVQCGGVEEIPPLILKSGSSRVADDPRSLRFASCFIFSLNRLPDCG